MWHWQRGRDRGDRHHRGEGIAIWTWWPWRKCKRWLQGRKIWTWRPWRTVRAVTAGTPGGRERDSGRTITRGPEHSKGRSKGEVHWDRGHRRHRRQGRREAADPQRPRAPATPASRVARSSRTRPRPRTALIWRWRRHKPSSRNW